MRMPSKSCGFTIGDLLKQDPRWPGQAGGGHLCKNERRSAKGCVAWVSIDPTGTVEFICFPEMLMANREILEVGTTLTSSATGVKARKKVI